MNIVNILVLAGMSLAGLVVIGLILAKLYRRSSKEISFVRTGFNGEKVIMNGGALVLPILHEVIPVNMNTLKLEIRRNAEQALITKDRMRVDVAADFYVRVKPNTEGISIAAQTLGLKTMKPTELKELVEGKFVDALRAVAAQMEMEELHEKRSDFVQKVQQSVSEDLSKNGLELEAVSLTGLDQTDSNYFNPNNAFDAEGMTKLAETIEKRRKERNDIQQNTDLEIRLKTLDAEKQRLEITRNEEYAKLEQSRELAIRRAEQQANIAEQESAKKREAEEARISADKQIELQEIMAKREIESESIKKEQAIEQATIERKKAIELAEQDRAIAIAEKSRSESEAKAHADKARADAVKAEEEVITVRSIQQAERAKSIELIKSKEKAEKDAIAIVVAAETQKKASVDNAEALRIEAEAQANKVTLQAKGEADAQILLAQAQEETYKVEAEGKRAINEASNTLSLEQIEMQIKLAILKHLPEIVRESVKPMEKIDEIKLLQFGGNGFIGQSGDVVDGTVQGQNVILTDQMVNGALRYRSQAPIVDSLLNEIGIKGGDINGFTQQFVNEKPNA